MQVIKSRNKSVKVNRVRKLLLSAGNQIGNLHFIKKTDGKKRRMSYRLHVRNPTYAKSPSNEIIRNPFLLTVFDVNKVIYNCNGKMIGRGAYRSVPLENVTRVSVNGKIYKFV